MNLSTALLAVALLVYIVHRQFVSRPVTRRDYLLPALGGLYIASRYAEHATGASTALVFGCALGGITTGLAAGALIRIWKDDFTRLVYQYGGWQYVLVLLGLIAVRIALRFTAPAVGLHVDGAVLNDAFIAMAVGNYLGRSINVGVRALRLVGGDTGAIPGKREAQLVVALSQAQGPHRLVGGQPILSRREEQRARRRARRGW